MIAVTSTHSPPRSFVTEAQTLVEVTTLMVPVSPGRVSVGLGVLLSVPEVKLM